jgi:hypothetical protein
VSDFVDVIAEGDLRKSLVAIRDLIAAELEPTEHVAGCDCECGAPANDGRVLAALSKELRTVIDHIEKLPGGKVVSDLDRIAASVEDELAPRREARQSGAAAP